MNFFVAADSLIFRKSRMLYAPLRVYMLNELYWALSI